MDEGVDPTNLPSLLAFEENERRFIESGIREKYAKVAVSPSGLFKYPTGRRGLEALGYDRKLIAALPESVAGSFCGVGNPFSLGPVNKGEWVLDVGCGAGVDTILAGIMVGPSGRSIGIDMSPEMLTRAKQNLREITLDNVTFQVASAESLPFPDESFDLVISNGVLNLVPDKRKALREIFRVLKPGGRLQIADQVLAIPLEGDRKTILDRWHQ